MKRYLLALVIFTFGYLSLSGQDVGISGGFFASMVGVSEESDLHITFSNNSFDTPIQPFGAYVQIDFPTTGEYSAPTNPPTGNEAGNFNWTFNPPNIWIGIVNTTIPTLSSHQIIFTVEGEAPTINTPTVVFTDLSGGSDDDPQNNNSEPLLAIQSSLPVEFIEFYAKGINCDLVQLNWSTATEINNEGFEVLFSTDGKEYNRIGFVKGNGNSYTTSDYTFDHNVADQKMGQELIYRLKQIDFDGSYSNSRITNTERNCEEPPRILTIGPNPTSGVINFNFEEGPEQDVLVSVFNYNNQLVKSFSFSPNTESYSENLKELTNGLYLLQISIGDAKYLEKVIVTD